MFWAASPFGIYRVWLWADGSASWGTSRPGLKCESLTAAITAVEDYYLSLMIRGLDPVEEN